MKTAKTRKNSLTDFKRNTAKFLQKLKKSGQPLVLTVNGESALVVQEAESYQKLVDLIDRLEAIEGIRRGLEDVEQGRARPLEEFDREFRQQHGIPNSPHTRGGRRNS